MKAKNKIFIALAIWVAVCASMLLYFFHIFDNANQGTLTEITKQKQELSVLEAEQESFKLANQDLNLLVQKPYQPDDFFSRDVTLVKELVTLENLGSSLDVNFALSGLSGTVKSAPKAKTQSDIVTVPYNINLSGAFPRVVDYIETLENLSFITHLTSLNLSRTSTDAVSANMTALFYLRKQ